MSARTIAVGAALCAAALSITVMPSASASSDDVVKRGSCSGASDWKLKAGSDDGRIEVEGEVDSNVVGQTWNWRILHNGDVSARGTSTTSGPSGSFEVRRTLVNASGTDNIGWRARNPQSGELCRGGLSL